MARRKQPVIPDALPATDGSGSEGLDGRDLAPRSYISPLLLPRSVFNAGSTLLLALGGKDEIGICPPQREGLPCVLGR